MLMDHLVDTYLDMMKKEGNRAYDPKYAKHCAGMVQNKEPVDPKPKQASGKPKAKKAPTPNTNEEPQEDKDTEGEGEGGEEGASKKLSIAELLNQGIARTPVPLCVCALGGLLNKAGQYVASQKEACVRGCAADVG
eukprot:1134890-Alexandrium_andersonii.AAC.1